MSGGHYDYQQYKITEIADQVEQIIRKNDDTHINEWGDMVGYGFPPEVLSEIKTGLQYLRHAAIYAQRIDWLVSGDDGDDDFIERLKEDLKGYEGIRDTEMLKDIVNEIIAQPMCPLCFMQQWNHKPGCPMPEAYERFGLSSEEKYYVS